MKEPNPGKSCKAFAELISAYVDGQLTESQTAAVEDHLKECPECARQLDQYRLINDLINTEKVNCPVDLTATVMAGLEREQLLTGLDDLAKPPTSFRTWLLRTAAAAAMIGLIVYAGSLVIHFTGSSAKTADTSRSESPVPAHPVLAHAEKDRIDEHTRPIEPPRPVVEPAHRLASDEYAKAVIRDVAPQSLTGPAKAPRVFTGSATEQPKAVTAVTVPTQDMAGRDERPEILSTAAAPVARPAAPLAESKDPGPDRATLATASPGSSGPAIFSVHKSLASRVPTTGTADRTAGSTGVPKTTTRPAETEPLSQRVACGLDRQVPLTYTIKVPDLPSWMFVKEQVLDALKENQVPPLTDGREVRRSLDARTEFFYQARKGLDLAPGPRRAETLFVVRPEKFMALYARLQQSGMDNAAQHLHPELQRFLARGVPSPALTGLIHETRRNLGLYFEKGPSLDFCGGPADTLYTVRTAVADTQPALTSQPAEVRLLPVLINVELDPRLTTAPSPTTQTTQPTTQP